MKIAIIGGAGVRTPLLINGLTKSDLPLREIALFDIDQSRLNAIAGVARHFLRSAQLTLCSTSADAVRGADFVFTSIRVGGIEQRARDEAAAQAHGVVGQETIGPAGFAMAVRTIPPLIEYLREIERIAPSAWVINFANPVGPVTQALLKHTRAKVVGICDTPTELFEEVAHALDLPSTDCYFDYFGLNHHGWLREVYHRGQPQLSRLWGNHTALARLYRAQLFAPEYLSELRLLPTEYVYYYVRPKHAFENMQRAGQTRGGAVAQLNQQLFRDLAVPAVDATSVYENYLAARNASYMQIESGSPVALATSPWAALTGYDKIALAVVRAIHFNTGAVIPLNVRNNGNLPLADDDSVEVPCVVNAAGVQPLHVPAPPPRIAEFIARVKHYERLTIDAAVSRTPQAAVEALAANPLVADRVLAHTLYDALAPLW